MHFLYVLAAANLYAQMHGLLGSHDQTALKELLQLLPEPASMHQSLISDGAFTAAEFGEFQSYTVLPSRLVPVFSLYSKGRWGLKDLKLTCFLSLAFFGFVVVHLIFILYV